MKKVVAILFSLIILVSNLVLGFSTHFCGESIVSSKVIISGGHAPSCGMSDDKDINFCKNSKKTSLKDNCCKDKYSLLQTEKRLSKLVSKVPFQKQNTCPPFISYKLLIKLIPPKGFKYFNDYIPPPVIKSDRQVLYQKFII